MSGVVRWSSYLCCYMFVFPMKINVSSHFTNVNIKIHNTHSVWIFFLHFNDL